MNPRIIELAREAHQLHWMLTGDAGQGDRRAAQVTQLWQQTAKGEFPHLVEEFPIEYGCNEKIDLFDPHDLTAYELKVSPNNSHFEFYRDVFKVLARNHSHHEKIKKFVFIAHGRGYDRLTRGLGLASLRLAPSLGFEIELTEI